MSTRCNWLCGPHLNRCILRTGHTGECLCEGRMSRREVWRVRLILLRFMREAQDRDLLNVALYAARAMAGEGRRNEVHCGGL